MYVGTTHLSGRFACSNSKPPVEKALYSTTVIIRLIRAVSRDDAQALNTPPLMRGNARRDNQLYRCGDFHKDPCNTIAPVVDIRQEDA